MRGIVVVAGIGLAPLTYLRMLRQVLNLPLDVAGSLE